MQIWTAQHRYPGPYKLDITVKGNDPTGKFFAPTWGMVNMVKDGLVSADIAEASYREMYQAILDGVPQYIWNHLMAQPYVVLTCFCAVGQFCHRTMLRDELVKRGAIFNNEITDFSSWEKRVIDNFHGEHGWASNFSSHGFWYQDIWYPTNEHFFQAWKGNPDDRVRIAALSTPGKAKRAGKKVILPWNWDGIKDEIMMTGLTQKFTQNPDAAAKLRATEGIELVEGNNWHDNYWGNCRCIKCQDIIGLNKLGKSLMALRETI